MFLVRWRTADTFTAFKIPAQSDLSCKRSCSSVRRQEQPSQYQNYRARRARFLRTLRVLTVQDVASAKEQLPLEQLSEAAQAFVKEFGPPQSLVEPGPTAVQSWGSQCVSLFLFLSLNDEDCIGEAEKTPWGLALAAEFKRASPSKGDISPDLDAAEQARRRHALADGQLWNAVASPLNSWDLFLQSEALVYSHHGASILSVLTEPKWFKGSLMDLRSVRVRRQLKRVQSQIVL